MACSQLICQHVVLFFFKLVARFNTEKGKKGSNRQQTSAVTHFPVNRCYTDLIYVDVKLGRLRHICCSTEMPQEEALEQSL